MPTKQDLEEKLNLFKEQIEFLKEQLLAAREDKESYVSQVGKLQDALINIRAPDAYRDMKADEGVPDPAMGEYMEREMQVQKYLDRYANDIEKPLFQSGEELQAWLEGTLMETSNVTEPSSLHNNEES